MIVTRVMTLAKKTTILYMLDLNALFKIFPSYMKRVNFRILKTRNKRNALMTTKYWVPIKSRLKYVGRNAMRSIKP
ncbi:hypothetical protein D3C79_1031900 [compost metagenome]